MIRLFAALAVPGDAAEALAPHQTGPPGARWSAAENLHITLRFFGEMAEDRADDLDLELSRISGRAMTVAVAGVGAFGEGDDFRAVWAGVGADPAMEQLARRCETAARRVGLKPEARAWRPHVTLAYLRRPDPTAVASWSTPCSAYRRSRPPRSASTPAGAAMAVRSTGWSGCTASDPAFRRGQKAKI